MVQVDRAAVVVEVVKVVNTAVKRSAVVKKRSKEDVGAADLLLDPFEAYKEPKDVGALVHNLSVRKAVKVHVPAVEVTVQARYQKSDDEDDGALVSKARAILQDHVMRIAILV